MSDVIKSFLRGFRSKKATNTSPGLKVSLNGSRKLLPTNDISNVINQYEQYLEEREACNTVRLTCQVNPICSNVLFNRITEIVSGEGSGNVTMVNYGFPSTRKFDNVICKSKNMSFWSSNTMRYVSNDLAGEGPSTKLPTVIRDPIGPNVTLTSRIDKHPTNAIRDTQLSKDENGLTYHCGLDIFNNHLIRSNTFKTVCNSNRNDNDAFNTIADTMRDVSGNRVAEKLPFPFDAGVPGCAKLVAMHLYEVDDLFSFDESVKNRLIHGFDGWFGFRNRSKIKSYINFAGDNKTDEANIERPIMSKGAGDFIDMYPGREYYSFIPRYNSYRGRIEQNWNYCITYPSSSYTPSNVGEPFSDVIDPELKSLKIACYDENTRSDNGTLQLVFYCVSKHGLAKGDTINVYKTWGDGNERNHEKIIDSLDVSEVVDDYIFTAFNPGLQISSKWVTINNLPDGYSIDGQYVTNGTNYYRIINGEYANIDDEAQELSFKKVVNDIECSYYVRIFSRLPNFKYASGDTSSEYEIYRKRSNGKTMLETYQSPEYDFESHVSRLAFAKNIYADGIGQIVYTDDINIGNLKDNLGRPLSSLYLTIVKNNRGYKEWYGFGMGGTWKPEMVNEPYVEYSHCFGKVMCGIEMSSMCDDYTDNIRRIEYGDDYGIRIGGFISQSGKTYETTSGGGIVYIDDNEVWFDEDTNYYGDISYFDEYNSVERHIQPVMHRVNTAQRESKYADSSEYFKRYVYDEIQCDDYDALNEYEVGSFVSKTASNGKNEGYFYIPHYEIRVNTFGKLRSITPDNLRIRSVTNKSSLGKSRFEITCLQNHYLTMGDKSVLYDKVNRKYYDCTALPSNTTTNRTFTCSITDEAGKDVDWNIFLDGTTERSFNEFKLMKMDNLDAPSYARILRDGTCRVIWRDLVKNGMNMSDNTVEEYPFTNGAFYVNRRIDLYLRRQDPYDEYTLYDEEDIFGVEPEYEEIDNYVEDKDIVC